MRELEASDACGNGARERALRMAEQFGLGERFRNRRGVERDEALIGARAVVMNRACDQFLAGSSIWKTCCIAGLWPMTLSKR
jgi:hypothetical protein